MAAAYGATTIFLQPFTSATPFQRKRVVFASSVSISSPIKLRRKRKNYLRPKILKTLTKPLLGPLLPESPSTVLIEAPLEGQPQNPSEQFCDEELKISESHEVSSGVFNGSVGNVSKITVFKIGLYLVGAFVFQTICAVWILRSANSYHKDGILGSEDNTRVLELGMYGNYKGKSKLLVNGSRNLFWGNVGIKKGDIAYVDGYELEEKIVEIQAMAREARERERVGSKANNNGLADGDSAVVKTGIEKEVDSRLVKLRKSLKNRYEKPLFGYLSKDGVDKDGMNVREANVKLMFKKKYKFRSPSISQSDNKPKGFQSLEDQSISKVKNNNAVIGNRNLKKTSKGNDAVDSLDNDQQLDLPNGEFQGSNPTLIKEDGGKGAAIEEIRSTPTTVKKLRKGKERTKLGKTEPIKGVPQDDCSGRHDSKAMKLGESNKMDKPSSPRFTEDQGTLPIVNNGSLKGIKVGNKQSIKGVWDKKSGPQTNFWWLTLPYVFAILMCRGRDGEGPEGLFSIKGSSHAKDNSSHVVAFEDRGDATNLCYLLQSFFKELGDFSTDIVPMPIEELDEAVKSHIMKMLVVKKGQLQLYAGQPLAEVENSLRSMIGQS